MKYLKRNLVNASMETLINVEGLGYGEQSRIGNEISDAMVKAITPAIGEHSDNYRAVVQGLFESGYLSVTEADFSFDQLLAYALGVKMYHALDAFNELFDKLVSGGYIDPRDHETTYNPSGDNYYSAMTFGVKPDEDDVWAAREATQDASNDEQIALELWARGIQRKVIFVENQSPCWCYVLDHSIHTGEPQKLHMVRLQQNYDDPSMFQTVMDMEANFNKPGAHSPYNSKQIFRVVATLDIDRMFCDAGWWEPKTIEYCLFNIYSGRDSISITNTGE